MNMDSYLKETDRVRFSIPDSNGSGIKYQGILRLLDDGLKMEFIENSSYGKKPDGALPWKKWANQHLGFEFDLEDDDGVKIIEVGFEKLGFIKRRDFLFFSTLLITSDSIKTFTSIPAQKMGRLRVYIGHSQKYESAAFVTNFNIKLADWRMNNADSELERQRFKA